MMTRGLFAISALCAATAITGYADGNTANGCTYQVINGKYLYSCEAKAPNQERVPSTTIVDPAATAVAAPAPTVNIALAPPSQQVVRNDAPVSTISAIEDSSSKYKGPSDAIYVGAQIGSTTITEDGSTTGLGLSVSANVDENVGFEIGYTYAKKDIFLGLNQRGGAPAPTPSTTTGYNSTLKTTDSTLTAHLLSGEIQFFLTDFYKRLRPYAGVGLGYKSSTLDEDAAYVPGYNRAPEGSLQQSSLGLVASLGTKLKIGKQFMASVAFRAYRPFSTQNPTLNSGNGYSLGGPSTTSTRLSTADSVLTEAGLYQIVGGFHVAF